MAYDAPGKADQLSGDLVTKWNEMIQAAYADLLPDFGSRFFQINPDAVPNPIPANVHWFGDPAEPNFCIGSDVARQLSDWGVRGRHVLHNEYCEYHIIERPDATGKMRPKRVRITTELREYWLCLAMFDPNALRNAAQEILGFQPFWKDLYGVDDPSGLTPSQRKIEFSKLVAGHGNDRQLQQAGVPAQPTGTLNTENVLFMTHPINGLDDLLYIVMFGAKPFARQVDGVLSKATREQIFRAFAVEHLACRHADPAAAMGAYDAAFAGSTVAFANPLGMYILSFAEDLFLYLGEPVPKTWIRWGRGKSGMYQRLEFGPADADSAFLSDVVVAEGGNEDALSGGFQVVQHIEVGPLVIASPGTPIANNEYVVLNTSDSPIRCGEADVCQQIRQLKAEYDSQHPFERIGPRNMGRIG